MIKDFTKLRLQRETRLTSALKPILHALRAPVLLDHVQRTRLLPFPGGRGVPQELWRAEEGLFSHWTPRHSSYIPEIDTHGRHNVVVIFVQSLFGSFSFSPLLQVVLDTMMSMCLIFRHLRLQKLQDLLPPFHSAARLYVSVIIVDCLIQIFCRDLSLSCCSGALERMQSVIYN